MQHQLEEEKEWRLRSGLEHLLAEHKALQLIIRIFVAREQMNITHEEVSGKSKARCGQPASCIVIDQESSRPPAVGPPLTRWK